MQGAERKTVEGDVGERLDEYLTRLEAWGFSGAILAVRDGKVVLEAGYGMADPEHKVPATPATVWSIGSITKQFTAAAILKLEMQGKLHVEDPISKFFKDVPPDKAGITLHQLLTHTAGLAGALGDDLDPIGRDAFVKLALGSKLHSPPGQGFFYSNVGFSLLAAVVELVSGQSYEQYLAENLFRPAGMTETGYRLPKWEPARVAKGSRGGEDRGLPPELRAGAGGPGWHLLGNGGILSTPGDMLRWHQALLGDAVLSAEAKRKLFTPHVPMAVGDRSYGYGWGVSKTARGTRRIAHNGGNGVFAADFQRFVDEGAMFFTASNQAEFPCIPLSPTLESLLFGGTVELPPPVVKLDPSALQSLAGTYALDAGGRLTVAAEEGRLAVAGDSQEALAALAGADEQLKKRMAELDTRVAGAVAASVKGDNHLLYAANGQPGPYERFDAENKEMWQRMQRNNGPFQRFEVVGTTAAAKGLATYVRLSFEKGVRIVEYGWMGPEIDQVLVYDQMPGQTFMPQSVTEFAAFDPRSGRVVHLRFDAGSLIVSSSAGEVKGKK
jgi:CubicO group peptidase (beta-lactamase class C family)